ncbi:MAG: GGDEF domain-containing protein [Aquabacterium sp.]|nr:GGDEF domain-containing protein [Aquabacterium sp.]
MAYRLTAYSASEVALLLVALQYTVLTPAWCAAALVLPGERRAAAWWAAYAGGSALGLTMIVVAMHLGLPPLRAAGNVAVLSATLALQRGIWAFTGQRACTLVQVAVLAVTVVLSMLALRPDGVWARITVVSGLWAGLYLWSAVDVWRHVRQGLRQRWGWLYAAPMLLAAAMLGLRTLRGVVSPETVIYEVEQNTVLSVGSSLTGLVAALLLQMMLVSLLVSRLVGRLARLSRYDPLTGLLNRRAMDELLVQEEQRVRRLADHAPSQIAGQMAVLMIDIDHFKQLNDQHGHAVGDRALRHLASVMSAQLRDIDHLARWGGEEFIALLPATGGAEAMSLAQRLCDRVRSLPLVDQGVPVPLTASLGVAGWLGPHDSLEALLVRADEALYAAKRAGRDQVGDGLVLRPLVAMRSV